MSSKGTTIKVEIKNLPQIKAAFRRSPYVMTKNLKKAVSRSGLAINREQVRNVSGGRGIRVVTTGLKKAAERGFSQPRPLMAVIHPNIEYAYWVHDGTKFMRARPFLQNAVDTEQNNTDREFEKAVQDTLDTIGRSV